MRDSIRDSIRMQTANSQVPNSNASPVSLHGLYKANSSLQQVQFHSVHFVCFVCALSVSVTYCYMAAPLYFRTLWKLYYYYFLNPGQVPGVQKN